MLEVPDFRTQRNMMTRHAFMLKETAARNYMETTCKLQLSDADYGVPVSFLVTVPVPVIQGYYLQAIAFRRSCCGHATNNALSNFEVSFYSQYFCSTSKYHKHMISGSCVLWNEQIKAES
jgi:hypothetical protein